jgi:hypothetical protein
MCTYTHLKKAGHGKPIRASKKVAGRWSIHDRRRPWESSLLTCFLLVACGPAVLSCVVIYTFKLCLLFTEILPVMAWIKLILDMHAILLHASVLSTQRQAQARLWSLLNHCRFWHFVGILPVGSGWAINKFPRIIGGCETVSELLYTTASNALPSRLAKQGLARRRNVMVGRGPCTTLLHYYHLGHALPFYFSYDL